MDDPRTRAVLALRQAAAVDPRFAPHVGLVLETRGLLGRGGMGTVHEVLDRRLGRVAALKVMHEVVAPDDPDARRFVREAEVTARLDHPAIPPVYEAGTDASGRQYLLMRRIEGEVLSRRIEAEHADGPPERARLRALVEVVVKVCDAVAYAHAQGVVHRDLKPANVMVGRFGEVLVLDWGLVRILGRAEEIAARRPDAAPGADPQLTLAGGALGTPGYMPPEQIEDASGVDARADVFALGALLCHVLTGRGPIEGDSPLNKISLTLQGRIARPRDLWPGVPPALDAIAAAALAPEREARTASAAAVADDLRAWLADEPIALHREGLGERLGRTLRRRPDVLVGLVAGLLLLAGLSVAGGLLVRARSREQASADAAASAAAATSRVQAARDELDLALDRFAEAEEALGERRLEGTAALVSEALSAVAPTRGLLWIGARLLSKVNRPEDAARLMAQAPGAVRTRAELLFLHGLALRRRDADDTDLVTEPLERLLAQAVAEGRETDQWLWVARAREHAQAGRHADAEGALDHALALLPMATTFALRGRARLERGDLPGAASDFDAGARIASDVLLVWRLRLLEADARLSSGDYAGAAQAADRALVLSPWSRTARLYLAQAHNRAGAHAAALKELVDEPGRVLHSEERSERAWARWELGDRAGALADAAAALAEDPTTGPALHVRAESRLEQGDLLGAGQDFRALQAARDTTGVEGLGVVAALLGQGALAEEALSAVILDQVVPTPRPLLFRGLVRLRAGDARRALLDLDRAIRLGSSGPFGPLAWKLRGQARALSGDLVGAVADLHRYLEVGPSSLDPGGAAEAQAALDQLLVRLHQR